MAYPPQLPPPVRDDLTPQEGNHALDHNQLAAALAAIVAVIGTDPVDGSPGRLSVDGIVDAITDHGGGGQGGPAYDDTAVRALITQEATTRATSDSDLAAGLAGKASTSHMHTAAQVSDFAEAAQDAVAAMLASGANVTLAYNDAGDTLTVTAAGPDVELMRDTIGAALVGVGNVAVTVNDAGDTITISTTATVNATDAALRDRSTHTGTQSLDTTTDSATRLAMTSAERTKVAGVASGATANATDAQLRDRTTHTGEQPISTITGLTTALSGKQATLPAPTPDGKLLGVASGAYALVDPPAGGGGSDVGRIDAWARGSGNYTILNGSASSAQNMSAGQMHTVPIYSPGITLQSIACKIATGAAGATVRLGCYAQDDAGLFQLVYDFGAVDASAGNAQMTLTGTFVLPKGTLFFGAVAVGGAPALVCGNGYGPTAARVHNLSNLDAVTVASGPRFDGLTGPLPATITAPSWWAEGQKTPRLVARTA